MRDIVGFLPLPIVILLTISFMCFAIHTLVNRKKEMDDPNTYILEAPEPVIELATIIELTEGIRKGGIISSSDAGCYIAIFELRNGEQKEFAVPFERFCEYQIGQKGNLITQNNNFLDFDICYDAVL